MTTQTVTGALEKREAGPVTIMWNRGKHFAAILPDHIDVKAFLGTAAAALWKDPKLMAAAEASPDSLINALMRCAALGHQPGTDEFYLTPRKVSGKPAVLGIEGYRGIVERMYRSGAVASVVVREVCEKDAFEYVEGIHDKPVHSVSWFGGGRGAMIGVYAYAILTTGAVSRVVILSRDDVMAAREASDSKDSDYSPWNRLDGGKDHPEFTGRSMWWKTAARRLEPWVPTSAEYRREQLRAAAAAAESMTPAAPAAAVNGHAEIIDAELVDDNPAPAAQESGPADLGNGNGVRPADPAPPATTQAGKRLLDNLDEAFRRLDIDAETQPSVIAWLAGDWTASAKQVRDLTSQLESFIAAEAAQGDLEEARSLFWQAYNKAAEVSNG